MKMSINHKNETLSFIDAFFFSLMVGAGETYFTAYSLNLGHSELQAGLLATMPLAIGGILQLVTPRFLNYFGNYKKWITFAAILQASLFAIIVFYQNIQYTYLNIIVCLYWTLFFFKLICLELMDGTINS